MYYDMAIDETGEVGFGSGLETPSRVPEMQIRVVLLYVDTCYLLTPCIHILVIYTHFVFMMVGRFSFFVRVLLAFYTSLAAAKAAQEPLVQQGYRVGEKIPVSCLNRTMYVCLQIA